MNPVITLNDLRKTFGRIRALDGITVQTPPGPIGLLGPNGAGKTTLLKLLLGQLAPDGGSARIAGHDPGCRGGRLALRRFVGYLPESDCLIPRMNAVETITTLGRLSGMSYRDAMKRAHEVLDYVGLEEQRYRDSSEYSAGMKQRLKLAQALVHDPPLLLLDEPTNGLDPSGRRHMLELIHDLGHRQEKNILLCSHLLPDVERTCRELLVIDRGRLLKSGPIGELTQPGENWLRVEVAGPVDGFAAGLAGSGWDYQALAERVFRVRLAESASDGDALFALAARCGTFVTALAPVRSTLEDVFLAVLADAERQREETAV